MGQEQKYMSLEATQQAFSSQMNQDQQIGMLVWASRKLSLIMEESLADKEQSLENDTPLDLAQHQQVLAQVLSHALTGYQNVPSPLDDTMDARVDAFHAWQTEQPLDVSELFAGMILYELANKHMDLPAQQ